MTKFITSGTMSSLRDDWTTPRGLFSLLDSVFHFTLDPCSSEENYLCEKHYTKEDDGLAKEWKGERVFMNPPYGKDIGLWTKKAVEETRGGGASLWDSSQPERIQGGGKMMFKIVPMLSSFGVALSTGLVHSLPRSLPLSLCGGEEIMSGIVGRR